MRPYLNAGLILFLVATIAALAAGLMEETRKLRRLTELVAGSGCSQLRSEFSHVSFVSYHLALSMLIVATAVFLGSIALFAIYRWLARRIFEQYS